MSRIALIVRMTPHADKREAFIDLMRGHAENCLKLEEGCLYFDVGVDRADERVVILYEVYRDQQALDDHAASAHLARTREHYGDMLAERERVEVGVLG
ncbi:MAG: putative quinol monooxygenase [Pseudomonadota bacterium]